MRQEETRQLTLAQEVLARRAAGQLAEIADEVRLVGRRSPERMLNAAFTGRSARVRHHPAMRMKTFAWMVAAILVILLAALALDRHGGDLSSVGAWIHGR